MQHMHTNNKTVHLLQSRAVVIDGTIEKLSHSVQQSQTLLQAYNGAQVKSDIRFATNE